MRRLIAGFALGTCTAIALAWPEVWASTGSLSDDYGDRNARIYNVVFGRWVFSLWCSQR